MSNRSRVRDASLGAVTDDDVVSFWDALAARARGLETDRLTSIGRQGERLTLAYEQSRTGRRAKWTAVDNNADGYDVLSVVTKHDHRPLSIEVKASALGVAGTLHLTRGEWERATEVENHVFHLWAVRSTARPTLAVVAPKTLEHHIPRDSGEGAWELVEVPFLAFSTEFRAVAI